MATGRDASDVALTTSFGVANLTHFAVVSDWLDEKVKSGLTGPSVSIGSGAGQ